MWLGGTPSDDALFYPVQFPDTIDNTWPAASPSPCASSTRMSALMICASPCSMLPVTSFGPYAPDNLECIDLDGDWTYALTFSAADRTSLAGQTAYLAVFTAGDGVEPHMSAFVDDISSVIDSPVAGGHHHAHIRPARHDLPLDRQVQRAYGWVDICVSPCTGGSYITTVYADAAGNIACFLYSSTNIAPGPYPIQTYNLAGRTAEALLIYPGAAPPALAVTPTSARWGQPSALAAATSCPATRQSRSQSTAKH